MGSGGGGGFPRYLKKKSFFGGRSMGGVCGLYLHLFYRYHTKCVFHVMFFLFAFKYFYIYI